MPGRLFWFLGLPLGITLLIPVVFRCFLDDNNVLMGTFPWMTSPEHWQYTHDEIPDLSGKRALVTGANSGLGYATALQLALKGAETHMMCRSVGKCDKAAADIHARAEELGVRVKVVPAICDLSDLSSVHKFATKFAKKHQELDILVNNAGVMHTPFTLTSDDLEMQFGVNHVAHHLLTNLLLPAIKAASAQHPATIVSVSSNAHFQSYPEAIRLTETALNDEASYDRVMAYGQSKLANVLFTQELAERIGDASIFVNTLNPGAVYTDLTKHWPMPDAVRGVFNAIFEKVTWSATDAAITQLFAATSPKISAQNIRGKYFAPIARFCEPADEAKDPALQKKLWTFTEELLETRGFSY